ncbi:MAG: hypothetical protein ABI548_28745 [Polyangiaceae bacterium]
MTTPTETVGSGASATCRDDGKVGGGKLGGLPVRSDGGGGGGLPAFLADATGARLGGAGGNERLGGGGGSCRGARAAAEGGNGGGSERLGGGGGPVLARTGGGGGPGRMLLRGWSSSRALAGGLESRFPVMAFFFISPSLGRRKAYMRASSTKTVFI